MPFFVEAYIDDHPLSVAAGSAKEAFAEAVDWHVVKRLRGVCISDGIRRYSIGEFAFAMAQLEIAATGDEEGLLPVDLCRPKKPQ